MIEIIPNWHPIFVHFTIALISISTLCYVVGYFLMKYPLGRELLIVGRWCLWLGAFASIFTVIAGFLAYYSVAHDTTSHEAMVVHRNWAILSFVIILLISFWSGWMYVKDKAISLFFVLGMLLACVLINVTAWHGAELVYRYGLGVMSLPGKASVNQPNNQKQRQNDGHDHDHAH